jgi:hypothetical protein
MARRWERPASFAEATIDGDRLVVEYQAEITDDAGEPIGVRPRRAAISLASLCGTAADDVVVRPLGDSGALPGRAVGVETVPAPAEGAPVSLLVHDAAVAAPIPGNVFTRTSTAPWVYPLVPLAVCVDATSLPILLFFAPGPMVIGD